jgi:hypothetical protein
MKQSTRTIGTVVIGLSITFLSHDAFSGSSSKHEIASPQESFTELASRKALLPNNSSLRATVIKHVGQNDKGEPKSATLPFANFGVTVEFEGDSLEVEGQFTLGAASNGIDISKEELAVKLGTLSTTIPPGSFKRGKLGKISFEKVIDCEYWDVSLQPLGKNTFEFQVEIMGLKAPQKFKPEEVTLTIGDDSGRARGI